LRFGAVGLRGLPIERMLAISNASSRVRHSLPAAWLARAGGDHPPVGIKSRRDSGDEIGRIGEGVTLRA
jgi:hypothetical protein